MIYDKNLFNSMGIYCIKNIINNKVYVGATNNFRTRRNGHFSTLNRGIHKNDLLQHDWYKYGKNNFYFIILEICKTNKELNDREKYWIDKFNSRNLNRGYNLMTGGTHGNHAASSIKKTSDNNIGKMHGGHSKKHIGVYYESNRDKWRVILSINGKNKSFGSYSDESIAVKIHDYYSFKTYKRLDILNCPDDFKDGLPKTPPLYPVEVSRCSRNKYKGITKTRWGWQVQIRINYKFKYIGTFKTDIEGANAFDNCCWKEYHDLSKLNFPQNFI